MPEPDPEAMKQQRKEDEHLAEWINQHCVVEQGGNQIELKCYPNLVDRKVPPIQKPTDKPEIGWITLNTEEHSGLYLEKHGGVVFHSDGVPIDTLTNLQCDYAQNGLPDFRHCKVIKCSKP